MDTGTVEERHIKSKLAGDWGFSEFRDMLHSCGLDYFKVGDLLSLDGLEHIVFAYGQDWVLKVPRHTFVTKLTMRRSLAADYKLAQKYFPEYVLESDIYRSMVTKELQMTLQKRMRTYQYLSREILQTHPELGSQLQRIFKLHSVMAAQEKLSIDFVGWDGFRKNIGKFLSGNSSRLELANVVLVDDSKLRIIDFRLTPLGFLPIKSPLDVIYKLYGQMELMNVNLTKAELSKSFTGDF